MVIKNKIKSICSSIHSKQRLMITALIVVVLTSMSVGYAYYHEELSMDSDLIVMSPDDFVIYGVDVSESSSATSSSYSYSTIEGTDGVVTLESELVFNVNANIFAGNKPYIIYRYQIANFTNSSYTYTDFAYETNVSSGFVTITAPVVTGLNIGDILEPGDVVDVYVKYYIESTINFSKAVTVNNDFIFNEGVATVTPGSLQVASDSYSLIVDDNNMAAATASILNLYKTSVEYELTSSNSDVLIVDSNGDEVTFTGLLDETGSESHDLYFKVKDGVDLSSGITTRLTATTHDGAEYYSKEITLALKPASKWVLSSDVDGNGSPDVGDVITIDSESFYVYSNDGTTVKALAKYNLYVGGTYDEYNWVYTEYGDEATGLQDSKMVGYNANSSDVTIRYGTLGFGSNTDYESSTIKNYVDAYATKLAAMDANADEVTLITKEELDDLGCSGSSMSCKSGPSFLYTSSYWTKTITTEGYVWLVNTDAYYWEVEQWHSRSLGVRPVITVTLENLGME